MCLSRVTTHSWLTIYFLFTANAVDSPTLQILRKHGITMLPDDDADNTIVNSALQSGRKLMLSDAGKQLIRNYQRTIKTNATTSKPDAAIPTNVITNDVNPLKRKAPAVVISGVQQKTGALKTNKVIKILSAEEFNKMWGGKVPNNAFRKVSNDEATLPLDSMQLAKSTANRIAVMNKISAAPNLLKVRIVCECCRSFRIDDAFSV